MLNITRHIHQLRPGCDGTRIDRAFAWMLVIVCVTWYDPVYAWDERSQPVYAVVFGLGFIAMFTKLILAGRVEQKRIGLALFLILILLWMYFPFRPFSHASLGHVALMTLVLAIILPAADLLRFLEAITRFTVILSLGAIFVSLALIVGFDLPSIPISQQFRARWAQEYHLYPGTLVLSSQIYAAPWGGTLIRSSGIFPEPGHFGILCGLLWAGRGASFNSGRDYALLAGGVVSLSGAFLVIVFAVTVSRIVYSPNLRRFIGRLGILLTVALVGLSFIYVSWGNLPENFKERVIVERFDGPEGVLERRIAAEVRDYLSGEMNYSQILIGLGAHSHEVVGGTSVAWQGFVVNYGVVSICLIILFYLFMAVSYKRVPRDVLWAIAMGVVTIGLHRTGRTMNPLIVVTVLSAFIYISQNYQEKRERNGLRAIQKTSGALGSNV